MRRRRGVEDDPSPDEHEAGHEGDGRSRREIAGALREVDPALRRARRSLADRVRAVVLVLRRGSEAEAGPDSGETDHAAL